MQAFKGISIIGGGYYHHIFRFSHCNQPGIWPVQDPHLRLHWRTCYQCHLEERWGCDNSQYYPPADQESSWSCCGYLPDSAHHWLISGPEWHCGDIQLHSGECQRSVFRNIGYMWVDLNTYIHCTLLLPPFIEKDSSMAACLHEVTFPVYSWQSTILVETYSTHWVITCLSQHFHKDVVHADKTRKHIRLIWWLEFAFLPSTLREATNLAVRVLVGGRVWLWLLSRFRNAICPALGMQLKVWLVGKHSSHLGMQLKYPVYKKLRTLT